MDKTTFILFFSLAGFNVCPQCCTFGPCQLLHSGPYLLLKLILRSQIFKMFLFQGRFSVKWNTHAAVLWQKTTQREHALFVMKIRNLLHGHSQTLWGSFFFLFDFIWFYFFPIPDIGRPFYALFLKTILKEKKKVNLIKSLSAAGFHWRTMHLWLIITLLFYLYIRNTFVCVYFCLMRVQA